MKIRKFALASAMAFGVLVVIASAAQAVVMKTVYKGKVSADSFDEPAFFGQGVVISGLPFELSIIWDRDDPLANGQSGVPDGTGPGTISYATGPFDITMKIGTASRTFSRITADDYLSEFRENRNGNFSTLTEFSSGDDGSSNGFSCSLGVLVPGRYQPLFLTELYQISNATPLNLRGSCGLLQDMVGLEFGLDATSLTVAPLVSAVPVPPAIPLLLTGLAALFGVSRRKCG